MLKRRDKAEEKINEEIILKELFEDLNYSQDLKDIEFYAIIIQKCEIKLRKNYQVKIFK